MKRTDEQWSYLYKHRVNRLRKLIELDAPVIIIDAEARMVREAIHKGRWKMLRNDLKKWLRNKWWSIKWAIEDLYKTSDVGE